MTRFKPLYVKPIFKQQTTTKNTKFKNMRVSVVVWGEREGVEGGGGTVKLESLAYHGFTQIFNIIGYICITRLGIILNPNSFRFSSLLYVCFVLFFSQS